MGRATNPYDSCASSRKMTLNGEPSTAHAIPNVNGAPRGAIFALVCPFAPRIRQHLTGGVEVVEGSLG
jgi:hypothetical protein